MLPGRRRHLVGRTGDARGARLGQLEPGMLVRRPLRGRREYHQHGPACLGGDHRMHRRRHRVDHVDDRQRRAEFPARAGHVQLNRRRPGRVQREQRRGDAGSGLLAERTADHDDPLVEEALLKPARQAGPAARYRRLPRVG
jgi:hypothetical protein